MAKELQAEMLDKTHRYRGGFMFFLLGLMVGYALLVAMLFVSQRSLLYHADSSTPEPSEYGLDQMQAMRIPAEGGVQLFAWWRAPSVSDGPVLIYFHGNAGNLGYRSDKVREFLEAGIGVLLVTWRYNAGAGGKPSEASLIADGRAALEFVAGTGVADERIVLYGESLGSGVAVALAAEHRVGAVVLEAPYTSIAEVAQHHYWYVPAKWLVHDRFDSRARIGRVLAPIMIIHGERDRVVPTRFGRALYEAAPEPKEAHFIANSGHEDLFDRGAGPLILSFLERHLGL